MVVGHDVTVGTDDDAGSTALPLTLLARILVAEEETEEIVSRILLGLGLDGHLDKDHRIHRRLCREGEIRIIVE